MIEVFSSKVSAAFVRYLEIPRAYHQKYQLALWKHSIYLVMSWRSFGYFQTASRYCTSVLVSASIYKNHFTDFKINVTDFYALVLNLQDNIKILSVSSKIMSEIPSFGDIVMDIKITEILHIKDIYKIFPILYKVLS